MSSKTVFAVAAAVVILVTASCAMLDNWGTTDPPIARVTVLNFSTTTSIGITTEIYFSVANVTDEDLTGLVLRITQNPSRGVDLPFREMIIDRIPAHGTWKPTEPFAVRGRMPGSTAVFFTVTKDGMFLARDYATVNVPPEDDYLRHPFFHRR